MEKKIDLEDIFRDKENYNFVTNEQLPIVIDAMKEACKQILELAADNAEGDIVDDSNYSNGKVVIDKDSIIGTINQVE